MFTSVSDFLKGKSRVLIRIWVTEVPFLEVEKSPAFSDYVNPYSNNNVMKKSYDDKCVGELLGLEIIINCSLTFIHVKTILT